MNDSCWVVPSVKNSNGEIVESELWKDLDELTGHNREETLNLYKIAVNEEFIDSVRYKADFDKNGQITARSFLSLSGRMDNVDEILKRLNNSRSKKNITYNEADELINKFNSETSLKEDYIPSIVEHGDDDLVDLIITVRDDTSVSSLQEKLENNKLTNLIAKRLKELHVAYDFIGTNKFNGRFSTRNAKKTSDGLYHLIDISTGGDIVDSLIEESAHLATVSLKDSDLIKRLLNSITEDTLQTLFTDDEISRANINSENGKLELAGILVKKAMLHQNVLGFNNFLTRIKNFIYDVFSKGSLKNILSDRTRAKIYARQIANGFLFTDSMVDAASVEDAVKETNLELFSTSVTGSEELLQKTLNKLYSISEKIKNNSTILAKNLTENLRKKALLKGYDKDDFEPEDIATIVGNAVSNMVNTFLSNFEDCKNISFEGDVKPIEIGLIHSLEDIYCGMSDMVSFIKEYLIEYGTTDGEDVYNSLNASIKEIESILDDTAIYEKLLDFDRTVLAQTAQEVLGSDVYKESAKLINKGLKATVKSEKSWSTAYLARQYMTEKKYTTLSSIANSFRNVNNSSDIGNQIFEQAIRATQFNISTKYNEALSRLENIKQKLNEYNKRNIGDKILVTDFYEKLNDGTPTGNFIGPKNYSEYERQKTEIENRIKSRFLQELRDGDEYDDFMNLTKQQKFAEWINYRDRQNDYQEFIEKTHDKDNHDILNSDFDNKEYQRLIQNETFKEILQELMDWKKEVDYTCLVEILYEDKTKMSYEELENYININRGTSEVLFHTDINRLPMFSKRHTDRAKQKGLNNVGLYDDDPFKDYCLDVTSDNFGSKLTDIELNEFNDKFSLSQDGVQRIALYGINKLDNMSDLSTDLFMSLSLYANMAYRYSTIQYVYPRLMMMDRALRNREGNVSDTFKANSNKDRDRLINQFISPEVKSKKFLDRIARFGKHFGSIIAIRVLAISRMSGAKNYLGGARVVFNDAIGDNMFLNIDGERINVPSKTVVKKFANSLNPKHFISLRGGLALNKDLKFDKYINLIRRWDAARNPRIRKVLGGSKAKKIYNWTINQLMSNYATTDEALIGFIYDSFMDSISVYDADTGNKLKLSYTNNKKASAYVYDNNNNPTLKTSLVKDKKNINLYNLLKDAKKEILDILEENKIAIEEAKRNNEKPVLRDLDDENNFAVQDLLNYLDDNDINNTMPGLTDSNGRISSSKKAIEAIDKRISEICFTQEDEINVCEQINDYIISSQGLYGLLNANGMMADAHLAAFTRLKGWLFGFMQRWLFTNPSVLNREYKSCILEAEGLAMLCIFGNTDDILDVNPIRYKEDLEYRKEVNKNKFLFKTSVLLSMCIPLFLNSRKLAKGLYDNEVARQSDMTMREYLQTKGWNPDQLSKLSFMCTAFWIQRMISFLSRRLFGRGNFIQFGKYNYRSRKNRSGKKKKLEEPGLVFNLPPLKNVIKENTEEFSKRYEMWAKQGFPKVLNRRRNIDTIPNKNMLPDIKTMKGGEIIYCIGNNSYYRAKIKENRAYEWEKIDYGYYEPGTDEFNEHEQAMHYMNYYYDKETLAYHWFGALYRLSRAVEDEGDALTNPLRLASEITEIASPIVISGGVVQMYKLVKTAIDDGVPAALEKEANFWLKKYGLEYDGDGKTLLVLSSDGTHRINFLDWYNNQDTIDRFNESKWFR